MSQFTYEDRFKSAGLKKWVSAAAVADLGNAQAHYLAAGAGLGQGKMGIAMLTCALHNRSGGAAVVGVGARYPLTVWTAGTITAAGVYTDATGAIQDAVTGDFSLHTPADSGSGLLFSAGLPFNILGIIQSVAGDQTTPALVVEYWDGANWVNIAAAAWVAESLVGSTGERLIVFPEPSDWQVGGSGTGVPATAYNLRVRTTNGGAGTVTPLGSQVSLGHALILDPALANNGVSVRLPTNEYNFPRPADAIFPVFSVASRSNAVQTGVRFY